MESLGLGSVRVRVAAKSGGRRLEGQVSYIL